MEIIIVLNLKFQNIVLIVQHREMNVLLDTFLIRIVRELFISTVSSNNRIRTGNNGKLTICPSSPNTLNVLLGFNAPGTSGDSDT